jgi:glycogen debranching enzyme
MGVAEDAPFRAIRAQFLEHLDDAGVGTISEIFDAEPPFTPRGCISQAWSVAEVLRAIVAGNRFASQRAKERS